MWIIYVAGTVTVESCLLCIEHQSNPTLAQPGPGIHLHLHLWKFHQRRRVQQTFLSERKGRKVRGNVFLFTIFLLCSAALKSIQAREERQMDERGPCIVNVYRQSELCSDFHIFLLCNAVSFILRMKLVKNKKSEKGGWREILAVHYCLHRWKRLFRILHSYYKHICFWQQPFLSVQITVNN